MFKQIVVPMLVCFVLTGCATPTKPETPPALVDAEQEDVAGAVTDSEAEDAPASAVEEPASAPTATPLPEPTAEPTLLPTATPIPTEVPTILFQDDFSDVNSGWERYNEFDGVLDYHEGGYRMWVSATDNLFWVNLGQDFQDVRLEVEAVKLAGPDINQYGLICRLEFTNYNHYAFIITNEGQYGIVKKVGGRQFEYLGADGLQFNDAILTGDQMNHIRGDCVGNTLTLYVNGVQLITAQDDTLPTGDVGLAAGTFGDPGTDILFDNFAIIEP